MKKQIVITCFLFLITTLGEAQLLYLQQNYHGGVSVDGKEYYNEDNLNPDTLNFINVAPVGSIIKRALLISHRFPFKTGTKTNDDPLQIIFNSIPLAIDSNSILTPFFASQGYLLNEQFSITVTDVTPYALHSGNQLITPCQRCSLTSNINWDYEYDGFLLVLLYENSSMPLTNVAIFLNNKNLNYNMTFNLNWLNNVDNTKDVGLSFFTSYLTTTPPISFSLNSSLGNYNLGSLWFNVGYMTEPTSELLAPGSFYYQNNTLSGLRDDSNNPFVDSTDALCDIKTFIANNSNTFTLSASLSPVGANYINAFVLAYSTPCPVSSLKDTIYRYTICRGKSQNLVPAIATNPNYTYSWYATDSSLAGVSSPSVAVSPTASTTYYQYIDSAGCRQVQRFSVGVIELPMFGTFVTDSAICGGTAGSLTINPNIPYVPPYYQYSLNGGLHQTNNVFTGLSSGNYTANLSDNRGCSIAQTFTIGQSNPVHAAFSLNPDTVCIDKIVNFANKSTGNNQNIWCINRDSLYEQSPQYTFADTGKYKITLIAYNTLRLCSDTAYKNITIVLCPPDSLVVPNIFSPNGDGINDYWQVRVIGYENNINSYQCTIYDRWGLKVFASNNINGGWTGRTTSGEPCPEGTYFYVLSYEAISSTGIIKQDKLKGFVQLVR